MADQTQVKLGIFEEEEYEKTKDEQEERKLYHRTCLGPDCSAKFTTHNKIMRMCKRCKDSDQVRFGATI